MTRHRCSNRAKPLCPPDRDVDARAATATGAFEQRPNGRIQTTMIARRLGRRGGRPKPFPASRARSPRNAPMLRREKIRRHSMPIVPPAGGAL